MNGDELPFERGFEVYAKGTHKSEFDSNLLDSGSDPIWDAIREEAKLEVYPSIPTLSLLHRFLVLFKKKLWFCVSMLIHSCYSSESSDCIH